MAPTSPTPSSEPQWPPRSPHEALLSTPKGRERYRQMLDRGSPTPSPSRGGRKLPSVNLLQAMGAEGDDDEDEDEDEDEETLQLKLQEIQARLKLKKLQNAKQKTKSPTDGAEKLGATTSELAISSPKRGQPRQTSSAGGQNGQSGPSQRPVPQNQIQVPASPVRKIGSPQPQTSPSRVLLGIDKGLKAKDISLRRAPTYRNSQVNSETSHAGGYLRTTRNGTSGVTSPIERSRPLSFNERLASVRAEESSRAEKRESVQRLRTTAFGIGSEEMETFKKNAVDIVDEPIKPPEFSREEILSQIKPVGGGLKRSNTVTGITTTNSTQSSSTTAATTSRGRSEKTASVDVPEEQAAGFETYSSFHLSKRILPHNVLARHISGKKAMCIKDLLRVVKAPDFALPDVEQDIVVFAILAKKSEPRAHKAKEAKNGVKSEDRGKYMVMTLVDLEYEVDLFLFNSGFTRFWKLTEGTVIAILNPTIMPPPPGRQDTGRFSLVINSDEDSIVEIGKSRDLGGCQSKKRDGSSCGAWVNKKRTEHCEFHSNEAVRKQRGSRLEMNMMGFGGGGEKKKYNNSFQVSGYGKQPPHDTKSRPEKSKDNYDWETKTHWFISRSMSTADLIDGKDRTPMDRKDRAEFLKRDLESKERERDMMKRLGKLGNAAGRDYMRAGAQGTGAGGRAGGPSSFRSQDSLDESTGEDVQKPVDAKSLGLLGKGGSAIHLSPIKRKRPESSTAGSVASSNQSTYGWGSSLRDKLSRMKEGEKLRKEEHPPQRKKTRFVTEKGIREAGRESLGNDLTERQVALEDDEDELVIV